jgi:hypothetical protein
MYNTPNIYLPMSLFLCTLKTLKKPSKNMKKFKIFTPFYLDPNTQKLPLLSSIKPMLMNLLIK